MRSVVERSDTTIPYARLRQMAERQSSKGCGSRFESGGGYWRPGRESGRLGVWCARGAVILLAEAVLMTGDLARGTSCTPPHHIDNAAPLSKAGRRH